MGFFSRLFQPRDDGKPTSEEWSSLPDSDASRLVLQGQDAASVLTQIDIEAAIRSHEDWNQRLERVLDGAYDESMQPALIRQEDCCNLGQWLLGVGRVQLGHLPAYDMLVRRHRYFHEQAAELITLVTSGQAAQAVPVYKACRHAGKQVTLLLRELQRGLGVR